MSGKTCNCCGNELEETQTYPCQKSIPPIEHSFKECEKKACSFCSIPCQLEGQSKCDVISRTTLMGKEELYGIVGYKLIDHRTVCTVCAKDQNIWHSKYVPIIANDDPRDNIDCWFCETPILTTRRLRARNFIRDAFISKITDLKEIKKKLLEYQRYIVFEDIIGLSILTPDNKENDGKLLLQAFSEVLEERGNHVG